MTEKFNNPEPKKSWAQTGNLVMRTIESNPRTEMVTMQAVEFPEPGNYTIGIGLIPVSVAVGAGKTLRCQAKATVEWAVEGNHFIREVSVGSGISITGTAEGVRVKVVDVTPQSIPTSVPASLTYPVTITCTRGTRGTTEQPPTLSEGLHLTIAPGITQIPVPTGVGVVSVHVGAGPVVGHADIPAGSVLVQHIAGGNVVEQYDYRAAVFMPLDQSIDTVAVVNNGVTAINFTLDWGIDG